MIRQRELAPDDVDIAGVFSLPERMADNQTRSGAAPLIVRCHEQATARWLYPQGSEEVATNVKQPGRPHLPARSEVTIVCPPGEDAGKGLLSLSDLLPNQIGDCRPLAKPTPYALRVRHSNFGQFLRSFDRQRAQSHRVDQLKNRSVRADAERERKNRHRGEAFVLE